MKHDNYGRGMGSSPFMRLISVSVFYNVSTLLMASLYEPYFLGIGMTMAQIILTSAFAFIVPLLMIIFIRKFEARQCISLGLFISALACIVLAFFPNTEASFIARAMAGTVTFLFWMPFNIMYYRHSKKDNGVLGSIYYSIFPVLSLGLPALAGWIAAAFGYPTLFILSGAAMIATLFWARAKVKPKIYQYDWKASLKSVAGLRTLFFIEGFSILSITCIHRARHRPGRQEAVAVFTSLSSGMAMFFLGYGAVSFFRGVLLPLPLALTVDNSKNIVNSMIGREIMIDLGRVCAIGIGALLVFLFDIRAMLIMQTIAAVIYIPLFELKRKALDKC
ncbi:MAG: MFS transporter [Candidatus Micrarchaeota archaeon]|nr:MFS transporter [Candidatus Micrarchaeota archaeon]